MTSRENLPVTLTIILGILAVYVNARSWDLAVVSGHEIEFYKRDQTLIGVAKIAEARYLSGLAYDDTTRTMYFGDTRSNVSVFSSDLKKKNLTTKPLLRRSDKSYIVGVAFDTRTRTLFWSDALKHVIMKMHVPLNGPPEEPKLLHNLTSRRPHGIALDVCNSHIYWVNSNNTNPSIERSNLDGTERITIIEEKLYEPLAVTVDHANQKLYWIDDVEGIRIRIERSNLDGTEREHLAYATHQQPNHMAVDNDSIYWSDLVSKAFWTMPKINYDAPRIFKTYDMLDADAEPAGIITRDNVGSINCSAIARVRERLNTFGSKPVQSVVESYNNLTTSTEESESTTERSRHCINGHVDEKDGTCHCKLGFTGTYCETGLCHNYCLRGDCSIDSNGLPTCKCSDTFIGSRCEIDPCSGYCLHDGQCSVQNEKPICKCKYSEGPRCENLNDFARICEHYCASTESLPTSIAYVNCRCTEANQTTAEIVAFSENIEYRTLLPIFSAFIVVLVVLVIVLSYYVNKLRRRPRIKKRFVVSKGGVTPLTSRPQLPDNQCEITIENCCNMNICETPCFEPKLRTPMQSSNGSKKEEKNSLLDNMEGNSC